jgi:hypothetical protein
MTMTSPARSAPARAPTEATLQHRLSTMAASLTAELASSLAVPVKRSDVKAEVKAALQDLQGSVAFEALPEMACRLAAYRLSCDRERDVTSSRRDERSRM